MIRMEEWVTIRHLFIKGKSIRSISKELHLSRNTVRKAIKNDCQPKYHNLEQRVSQLDDYKERIEKMLLVDNFTGSRILAELEKMGYSGKKSAFYNYLMRIDGKRNMDRISEPYETKAGIQSQFDWSYYVVKIANKETKLIVFSTILSYSRKRKYVASLSDDQESVIQAIEDAFNYFGGATKEILTDNHRDMVDNADPEHFSWNKTFYEFTGYYKIIPRHCRIRTPKTKGKVENSFYYLEQHFIKGNSFSSFEDLEIKLALFNEKVNNKVHSNTRQTPNVRFEQEEKHLLTLLPEKFFVSSKSIYRKVNYDCLISYDANKYSVPYIYAGKEVLIKKIKGRMLRILSLKGDLIACHIISDGKYNVVKDKEHYNGLNKEIPRSLGLLKAEFIKHFGGCQLFLDGLLASKCLSPVVHLKNILSMRRYYSDQDIKESLTKCIGWKKYSSKTIIYLLRWRSSMSLSSFICTNINLQELIRETSDIKINLLDYEKIN